VPAQAPAEDEYETLELDEGPAPAAEPAFDVVAELAEPEPCPAAGAVVVPLADEGIPEDALADRPVPPLARDDRDEEDRRPRRRRRRRRRSSGGFRLPEEIIPGVGNFLSILIILGAVWVLLAGVALLLPPLGVLLMFLGMLLAFVGNIWFLIVAFQDDTMTGLLCLFLPMYALFFLLNNQDTAGRPFLIGVVGVLMMVSGGAIAGGMH
jgi:hypothetical protein